MKKKNKYGIIFIIILFIISFSIWQNNDIIFSDFEYKTEKINDSLDGYKIVQISDLHNKEFGKHQIRILNIIKDIDPDLIVITGDIIDSNHTDIDIALAFVEGAAEIAQVYYVTGNHEYMIDYKSRNILMQRMEQCGVIILNNETVEIVNEFGDGFYLVGLDDNFLSDNTLMNLSAALDINKLRIVLAHEPQYLTNYARAKVDLVLTGHAHGGQIRLPFIGGLIAPDQGLFPKYTSGTYIENDTTMIVSRGLGNSLIPVRVFNRPEIVMIELRKTL
ncbi:MAG: metallophosphoesterase [Eubacteriales bacterium]